MMFHFTHPHCLSDDTLIIGRPPKSRNIVPTKRKRGNARDNLLAYLKAEAPTIYARVVAREISAYAGAVEAGIRKKPTALDDLRRVWKCASPEERAPGLS